jgi:xylulokinase
MAAGLFIGLDVGTQGTKGLCIDTTTRTVVARASRGYGLIEGLAPGAAEQDPRTWMLAVREVVGEIAKRIDPGRLAGIGVSGQQHGLVVLDEHAEVVRPAKLWCDTETAPEAAELTAQLGRAVPTGFTASKLLWLARHEPESFARTHFVMLPHDFINLRLTGAFTTEAGDASGTGWFDARLRRWDPAALAATDPRLAEMLPRLVEAGQPAGRLTPEGAAAIGLPAACAGVPVSSGGGDNMLSAIGAGATRAGVAVLSLGTSATVFCYSDRPVADPDGLIAPFCDSTGGWLPLLCVMNATGVCAEVSAAFECDLQTLTREAAEIEPGAGGLLLLPYLQGERVPDLPLATATLTGLGPGMMRRGRVFRAALEGVSLNLALGLERMRGLGLAFDTLRLAGGGAANPLWRQILADALEVPVRLLIETESAALGAALQALWTERQLAGEDTGADAVAAAWVQLAPEVIEPDASRSRIYREARQRLERTTHRLYS